MEEEEEDAAGDFALNVFFTQTGSLTKNSSTLAVWAQECSRVTRSHLRSPPQPMGDPRSGVVTPDEPVEHLPHRWFDG